MEYKIIRIVYFNLVKETVYICINVTSGKHFINITGVGMGAAKSNETR